MKKLLKKIIKNIFANKYIQACVAWFFHFYIWFVYRTSKIIIRGDFDEIFKILKNNGLVILSWHGRIILAPVFLKHIFRNSNKGIFVLASAHRDGKIVSDLMQTFNLKIIEGSSIDPNKGSKKNKKSFSSIRGILKILSDKDICVLAADGPRGPAFQINSKVTELAQKTNTPIVIASISCKRKKIFNTWDKFEFPFPFNKIILEIHKAFKFNEDINAKSLNETLEKELNRLTKENDKEILK